MSPHQERKPQRPSRAPILVALTAAASLPLTAHANSFLGDDIYGYGGALASSSNLFNPTFATIGAGVEFSGQGTPGVFFEADFDADAFTVRVDNRRTTSVANVDLIFVFDYLEWIDAPRRITGISTLANNFPGSHDVYYTSTFFGSSYIRVEFDQPGGLQQPGEIREATFLISSTIIPPPLTGDYNGDGAVEQGDLDLVLNGWGGYRPIDVRWYNSSGFDTSQIDQEELDRVLNNWGSNVNAPNLQAFNVPEPASGATLTLLLTTPLLTRRRRR